MADELKRIYTIPLGDAFGRGRKQRTAKAVKLVRQFLCRHMKAKDEELQIDNKVNRKLWSSGARNPPRRIKITATKSAEGRVKVELIEEEKKQAKAEKTVKVKKAKPMKAEKPAEKKEKEESKKGE
ncbi:MAG: 50S ribosomal protein L31e [Candidatus Micrarchaeota archaeon]